MIDPRDRLKPMPHWKGPAIDVRPRARLRSSAPRADKHTGMRRARSGPGSRLRTGLAALVLLAPAAYGFGFVAAGSLRLMPGRFVPFHVGPRHPQTAAIRLLRGEYVRVRIEQLHHLALVALERPGHARATMRFCDAGRLAVIRISLVASAGGTYRLRIEPYEPRQRASGWVSVSAARPASTRERADATAESEYARAEWMRHRGAAASWTRARLDYRAAVAAARQLGDVTLLRAALTGEARLDMFRLDDYGAALALARQATELPVGSNLPGAALAWKTLSSADYYLARYPQELVAGRRALDLYRRSGDTYWQGIVLGNLAYAYRQLGRTRRALRLAHQSLAIARRIHDAFGVDFNLEAIGDVHLARGQFARAFVYYRRAIESLRTQPYPQEAAAVWRGLGELFADVNQPKEAREALTKALRLADGAQDSADALKVLADLGEVSLRLGDVRAALMDDQQGVARALTLHLPRDASFLMIGLGKDYAALGERPEALASFRRAIALARDISQSDSEAAAWQGVGDLQARAGRLSEARVAYRRALALWSRQLYRGGMAQALASLARLDQRRGAIDAARARIDKALALIESTRATLADGALRTAYFASQHAYFALGVSILMDLAARLPGHGYARQGLQLSERARARTLLDALHRAGRFPRALVPPDLARALRRNRAQLDAAFDDWQDLLQDRRATAARFAALRKRIEALQRSGDALEALARARNGRYAALADAHPASVPQMQRQLLGQHAAILEYWIGATHGYAWLIRSTTIQTLRLPGAKTLAPQVAALRRAITARALTVPGESLQQRMARIRAADTQVKRLSARLGAQILPDARALEGIRTLYVVADGPLYGVPFAALRPGASHTALVARTAVLEEPSVSVLLSLMRAPATRAPRRTAIAVFADPVYTRTDPRLAAVARADRPTRASGTTLRWAPEDRFVNLPRLPGSRTEALAIAKLSDGDAVVRMGFAATVRAVRATLWKHFAIAHFAVHTLLDPEQPALSGLVLTLFHRNGRPEQGVLWLRDIYSLDIPVDLVVLSSCHTLGGQDVPGEGLVGLYRAFLMAGARAVLGSLWSVQDRPTARLMGVFYANLLRRHLPPAQALRAAQRVFEHSRRYAAPYYWAGFSIEGAGAHLR